MITQCRADSEEAKREADMAMVLRPDDTMILYNAACVFCMMGNAEDALIAIKKAWEAGYRDAVWTRQDPDLALLHGNEEFEKLYRRGGRKRSIASIVDSPERVRAIPRHRQKAKIIHGTAIIVTNND